MIKQLVIIGIVLGSFITTHSMELTIHEKKHRDRVTPLLQKGENVDQEDGAGRTPLIVSAQHICPKTVAQLLAAGANCNIISRLNNGNALHFLFEQLGKKMNSLESQEVEDKAFEIIELLRASGIRLDHISDNGTVFHRAAALSNKSYICALMLPMANQTIKEVTIKKVETVLCALKKREQQTDNQLPPLPREVVFHIVYFGLSSIECKYSGLDKVVLSPAQRTSFRRSLVHEALPQLKDLMSPEESLQLQKTLSLEWNVMDIPCKAMDIAIDATNRKLLNPDTWKAENFDRNPQISQTMLPLEESSLD